MYWVANWIGRDNCVGYSRFLYFHRGVEPARPESPVAESFLRAWTILLPVCLLWVNFEPVFKMLGQEPALSRDTAKFLTLLIPGGLGYVYFEVMKKYLQAQGTSETFASLLEYLTDILCRYHAAWHLHPPNRIASNAGLNYLFCITLQFGLWGAPLATGLSYWLCFLSMVLYTVLIDGHQCWGGWSRQTFQNLGLFTRLAILGIIHVGAEWWAFKSLQLPPAGWGLSRLLRKVSSCPLIKCSIPSRLVLALLLPLVWGIC